MHTRSDNPNIVIVPREEVERFNAANPGNGLRDRAYWFEFSDGSNGGFGDLIDHDAPNEDVNAGDGHTILEQLACEFWETAHLNAMSMGDSQK